MLSHLKKTINFWLPSFSHKIVCLLIGPWRDHLRDDLTFGNGMEGIGRSRKAQRGGQPSFTSNTSSLSGGTDALTFKQSKIGILTQPAGCGPERKQLPVLLQLGPTKNSELPSLSYLHSTCLSFCSSNHVVVFSPLLISVL